MTRVQRIAAIVGACIAGLVLVLFVAGIAVVRTGWFQNMVRTKIVAAVEEGTGGRTEIGFVSFDWSHLRAQIRNFVLHGLEPAGAAPLFRADLLQVDLKLTSPFKRMVDIAYLLVETPQANIIVFPDGRTNIPEPKVKKPSDKSALETVVDLAIGQFDLRNGSFTFAQRTSDLNASGRNLRAQLNYNPVAPRYTGQINVNPLRLRDLDVNVSLPVALEKDKVTLTDAHLNSPDSQIAISASMDNLTAPRMSAHVNARLSLNEIKRATGLSLPLDTAHGPGYADADVVAYTDNNETRIDSARLTIGGSRIEASGNSQNVQFNATLALGEIGKLMRVSPRPEGTVKVGGNAVLPAANNPNYRVTANVDGRNIAITQGATRVTGVSLDTAVAADPHRVDLTGLRLAALGGAFTGSGSLVEMEQFRVAGNLQSFPIDRFAQGYSGVVSGPVVAEGNTKNTASIVARANLGIRPGSHGVPVSGKLAADYNGRGDTVTLGRSYLELPHTRADLSGALGQEIRIHLVSTDLNDFRPLGEIPVAIQRGGAATLDAGISGKISSPRIAVHAGVTNFAVDGRPFTNFSAQLNAIESGATLTNGSLSRGALEAQFSGNVGLRNWKPEQTSQLRAEATVRNAGLEDLLALAGKPDIPLTGALTADAHVAGTIGSPTGTAELSVVNGTVEGEKFDRLAAHAVMTDRSIDVPTLQWTAGPSRINGNATYQHALNNLQQGTVRAHLTGDQVQLANFQSLVKDRPGLRGTVSLNADGSGNIQPSGFLLTGLNANVAVRGLQMEGRDLGNLTATAASAGSHVRYNVDSNFAGSTIRVDGQTEIAGDHRTRASARVEGLPIDQVLAVAGRRDLPVKGVFAASAQVSGTLDDPQASGNFTVTKGVAYQEQFDRLQATVNYSNVLVDVPAMRLEDGSNWIELNASFKHPANNLEDGDVHFRVRSNDLQLARFESLRQAKPGLDGVVHLAADGAATLRRNATPLFSTLNANIAAHDVMLDRKPVGGLTATAQTQGREVVFTLASDFAHADINGKGRMQLAGDYPVDAQVNFSKVTYSGLRGWIGEANPNLDGALEGRATVNGPVSRPEALRANLQLTRLEVHSVPAPGAQKARTNFEVHNAAPIVVALDQSVVTVQSARLTGPFTNLSVTGSAAIAGAKDLKLNASGDMNLELLQALDPDIFSAGAVTLAAAVTGTSDQPVINGRVQLRNASFNMLDVPNGLTNGNGVIVFNGHEAVIQNLTGESGGGKIAITGSASYGGPEMQFRIQATADRVRILTPESITTDISAKLNLSGTSSRSLASGTVTINGVALHSHSDMGSILTQAAVPPSTQSEEPGPLAGMRLDVKIQSAPGAQFRTNLTQDLQADANLTLRGSVAHPGMLGRVVVTGGEVIFFGSKYNIDQGSVSFFNPQKIEPILNVNLATTVQGVDVSISVSGPVEKLKLAYRSDPPMQFSDLVSLLASGKLNTTDPVLAARQPAAPQQSFAQTGASTVLQQAVANPISGRMERLFGVSKFKIDPQITGASNTPQATLTLQQQVTREITFTYIQDVTASNPQIIRIEWAIDPQWSAVAQRDQNGIFDLDFFYKKRFR